MQRNRRVFDDVKGEGSSLGFLMAVVSWRFEMILFGKLLYFRSLGRTFVVVLVSFWLLVVLSAVLFLSMTCFGGFLVCCCCLQLSSLFFFGFSMEVAYLIKNENRLNGLCIEYH